MNDLKLRECPFCTNCNDEFISICSTHFDEWFVQCDKCGARTGTFSTDEGAVEAWNKRSYTDIDEKICILCKWYEHGGIIRTKFCSNYVSDMSWKNTLPDDSCRFFERKF